MINKIVKILMPIFIIILMFFININDVKAGYESSIECVYVLPLDYYFGSVTTTYDEIMITYRRVSGDTTITYNRTLNNQINEKFNDNEFDDYIIGKKGAGSEENRGENHRTCPSWIKYEKPISNDDITPISKETFYSGIDSGTNHINIHRGGSYVDEVYLTDESTFTTSETSMPVPDVRSITKAENPYYLFLKQETIDGIKTDKGNRVAKEYFETQYFDSSTTNIVTNYENSTFNKNYLNIANYPFETSDEFKKYALSSSAERKPYDSNMTNDEWKQRWKYFYMFEVWSKFSNVLKTKYSDIFDDNYNNEIYLKMIRYIKYSSDAKLKEKEEELSDREYTDQLLEKNSCLAECLDSEGILLKSTALTQCQTRSEYKTCDDCRINGIKECSPEYCEAKCKYAGTAYDICYNACLEKEYSSECVEKKIEECLGEEKYNEITESIENNQEKMEQLGEDLYSVSAPGFDIIFDKDGYKVKCEDVVVFHTIYKIMTIMAPILVILFGTLDYAKSVMGTDEQKILEARKKFPKRLLLLVLFVAIPTIISIIMSFTGGEANLMRCVILGK